jgi:osmoprotectant transport system ATP-binding protein
MQRSDGPPEGFLEPEAGLVDQAGATLAAKAVSKRFGNVVALDGVDLRVAAGERVALVGESGSGKTTLLRSFNRMVEPDSGEVHVRGNRIRDVDPVELRRSVGYVQQEGGLLPHWSVLRNASLVPRLRGFRDAEARAAGALSLVGLDPSEFAHRWPRELSGGQRQRVALARALAARPEVVLLDEPFGALDAITRSELQGVFAELSERLGITVLLVTHDLREAGRIADRIAVMKDGSILQTASLDDLRAHPATPYVAELLRKAEGA